MQRETTPPTQLLTNTRRQTLRRRRDPREEVDEMTKWARQANAGLRMYREEKEKIEEE